MRLNQMFYMIICVFILAACGGKKQTESSDESASLEPYVLSLALNSGAEHTNDIAVDLTISTNGSPNEVYITQIPGCGDGGAWMQFSAQPSWILASQNASNNVYVKVRGPAGESNCASDSITHDNMAPALSITSPLAAAVINSVNQNSVFVSGSCNENGQTVSLSGGVTGTAECTSGSWSVLVNFSSASEGAIALSASIADLAGNVATANVNVSKDTIAPSAASVTINSGAEWTNNSTLALTLSAGDAVDMWITEDSDCASGSWEPYATSQNFILNTPGELNSVYVKYRDLALNETSCLFSSIGYDGSGPTWSDIPLHANSSNSTSTAPLVFYEESAIDVESGILKYQYAVGTGTTGVSAANIKSWTDVSGGFFSASGLILTNGATYYVNMKAIDFVGNEAFASSGGWVVDNQPPSLEVISPANNDLRTDLDFKITGSCESPYNVDISYGTDISGDSTVSCISNTFIAYAAITGVSGNRDLTVTQTDASSNTSTVNLTVNFQKPLDIAGTVLSILSLSDGSTVYGGSFQGVSTSRDPRLVKLNASGVKDLSLAIGAGFNDQVLAVAQLSDGSLIVGGSFTSYRARPANRIAKISATGVLDTTFNPTLGSNGFNNVVRTIAVVSDEIYVGGDFTSYRGAVANRIAKLNSSGILDTTFSPPSGSNGANSRLRAIVADGVNLFIGGDFTTYRGAVANRIAKLDLNGSLETTFSPASGANGVNNIVRGLAVSGGNIYVAGDFTTFESLIANRIAKVSLSGDLDLTFNPQTGQNGLNSYANGLAISGTSLYIVGHFTRYRNAVANRIAKIDTATSALDTTFNPAAGSNGANNMINSVAVIGSSVFFGGLFNTYRGALAFRIAKTNSSGVLDTTFNPSAGANGFDNTVNTVLGLGSNLYIGGVFNSYRGSFIAKNIVKINSDGTADTNFSPQSGPNGTDGTVRALATDGSSVYIGGDFTTYLGLAASRVVKTDYYGNRVSGFNPGTVNNVVRSVLVAGADVYFGGDFTSVGGKVANRIAKVDEGTGNLNMTFNPASGGNGTNNSVRSIVLLGSDLYFGGLFTTYRGSKATYIAKVATASGALDLAFNPTTGANGFNSYVYSLNQDGSHIYAGGSFTNYRGSLANRLAKISSDGHLNTTFSPVSGANGVSGTVNSVFLLAGSLYVGGSFSSYRAQAVNNICMIDTSSGVLNTSYSPLSGATGTTGTSSAVQVVHGSGGEVYLGGNFIQYRNQSVANTVKTNSTNGVRLP
jgi:hypothetical protein